MLSIPGFPLRQARSPGLDPSTERPIRFSWEVKDVNTARRLITSSYANPNGDTGYSDVSVMLTRPTVAAARPAPRCVPSDAGTRYHKWVWLNAPGQSTCPSLNVTTVSLPRAATDVTPPTSGA